MQVRAIRVDDADVAPLGPRMSLQTRAGGRQGERREEEIAIDDQRAHRAADREVDEADGHPAEVIVGGEEGDARPRPLRRDGRGGEKQHDAHEGQAEADEARSNGGTSS